jgi:hypothetical protein
MVQSGGGTLVVKQTARLSLSRTRSPMASSSRYLRPLAQDRLAPAPIITCTLTFGSLLSFGLERIVYALLQYVVLPSVCDLDAQVIAVMSTRPTNRAFLDNFAAQRAVFVRARDAIINENEPRPAW